jgi:hypothetical protein
MRFTVGSLESAYSDNWKWGVPSFLNHDHLKPIAWSRVCALYFEPGMVRTANLTYVPENDSESKLIGSQIQKYYIEKTTEFISPYKNELLKRLKPYLSRDYKFCATESAAVIDKGIAKRVFPEIFETDDKHGLVLLSKLNPVAPGIFERDGLLIYASSFFRRSFSRLNTLNTPFLKRFQEISLSRQLNSKIALDPDMVGLPDSLHEVFEFQYWWGPLFNEKLDDIPNGVSIHKSNQKDIIFTDIESTEFWWYEQDGRKTFECEEVVTRPSLGISDTSYGCRFVHSMIDQHSNEPFHLDGAIRIYDEEKILKRWDVDISNSGKDAEYIKIWRLDGNISVSEWKELISHYYRDNMLVGEYFGGKDNLKDFKPELIVKENNTAPLSEYVPTHMEKGEGIRIALSYHARTSERNTGRKIRVTNSLELNNSRVRYVEADTLEIIKKLRKRGETLNVPPNTEIIAFEDMLINFPLFLHRGSQAVRDANVTLDVIHELCCSWRDRHDDRAITFNIGIEYDTKEAVFSFAGHIDDLIKWFNFSGSRFPSQESEIGLWCETAAKFLTDNFPESNDKPKLGELLNSSGMLHFERRFLSPKDYELYMDEKNKAVGVEIKMLRSETEVVKEIKNGHLQVAPAFIVTKSECSKCGSEYRFCDCSKYIENDVVEIMQKVWCIGVFWTKRKA